MTAVHPSSNRAEAPQPKTWRDLRDRLRPGQQRMADWQGGPLAVSAVPGSGKSTGMAIAAAILLAKRYDYFRQGADSIPEWEGLADFTPQRQLVLVTFTRSAAANLKTKIRQNLQDLGLPATGFAVYTLHGLALHIASRHPDRSGLNLDQMTLISPNQSHRLLRTAVEQWIGSHPHLYQRLLEGQQFDGEETERLRRQSVLRTEVLPSVAETVIHEAKSSGLPPEDLLALSEMVQRQVQPQEIDYNIPAIAAGLYAQYQMLLRSRNFLDYDDMILAALRVLEDPTARRLWQTQFFAVFEDEAQDSSPLQTRLLNLLALDPDHPDRPGHFIRVGDPNQAINSTFTPADPLFFRQFCQQCQLQGRLAEMDQSGRSSEIILTAANFMMRWVNQRVTQSSTSNPANTAPKNIPQTPTPALPFRLQTIHPVSAGDPQPDANPAAIGGGLELYTPATVVDTVAMIARRVAALHQTHPTGTLAVLVRENRQGRFLVNLLRQLGTQGVAPDLAALGIDLYEVGERDRQSHIPGEMLTLLQFCDRPHSPDYLKAALKLLSDRRLIPRQDFNRLTSLPEEFLYPGPLAEPQPDSVQQARRYCVGLLRARLELPHYQLIPFLALTLKYEQSELATADKLAERLRQQTAQDQSMSALLDALTEIVNAERFEPVETDQPESRYVRSGQLTIITMHKAKGLDWDGVFLPFLHEMLIPGTPWIPPQTRFLGEFQLAEVARAQIRASIHQASHIPGTIAAWHQAIVLKQAEEFRLLYVAMTRAKRLLWMSAAQQAPFTWSKPENLEVKSPCPVLPVLAQQFPQAMGSSSMG